MTTTTGNFELKHGDDFIIAIDVSGSMATTDCPGGLSRFDFAMEKTRQFCREAEKIDADGISVITFGHSVQSYENVTNVKVEEVLTRAKPIEMATRTDLAINTAYGEHTKNGNDRTILLIVTDGEPTSMSDVFHSIATITGKVKDPAEFRICFLTVGEINQGLRVFLTKLDDNIPGAKHDIVDVLPLNEVDFYAAAAGALTG
jgi:uncharacterized protein YegL